jgi:hypothetical protein
LQAVAYPPGEHLQLLYRARKVGFLRLAFRCGRRFSFQATQAFAGLTDARLELGFLQ